MFLLRMPDLNFFAQDMLLIIWQTYILFCDGKFRTTPAPFQQLFVLHSSIQDYKIPIS